jgi:signal transduction histidine kinase
MLPTNLDAQSEITKPFISGQTQKPGVGLVPGTWHQDHLYRPGNPWQNGWIGKVSIHVRRLDTHRLEVQVRDTGIGIKTEDINRLFTEFEQLDSGAARHFEGTGLGLALTKKIIEFQGGHISVESDLGRGSVFTVVLPVLTEEKKAA